MMEAMARTAIVRSVSLSRAEARLADELAQALAGGSFTELVRTLLARVGSPLRQQLAELVESGLDPHAQLVATAPTPADTDAQIADFYADSRWEPSASEADPSAARVEAAREPLVS